LRSGQRRSQARVLVDELRPGDEAMAGKVDKDLLERAFKDFAESSRRLERQYALLGKKLADLEREYCGRNRAAERTARLAAMGEMAAKIAHEIRNPLGSMLIFSTILFRDLEGQPRRRKLAGHMVESVRNLDRILSDMLVFSNRPEPVPAPVDLKEILEKALETCSTRKGAQVIIVREYHGDTRFLADERLLKQAFVNLLYNAFDAIGHGPGRLVLRACRTEGGVVEASIEDTGSGMDEATRERIFDPFFTTRQRGTGLGLAIVMAIVQAHGGEISCISRRGRGTRFSIRLPGGASTGEKPGPENLSGGLV